jgi:16S rRNA (cytosine967-C5)-methyltransferase
MNVRTAATNIIAQILRGQGSLSSLLPGFQRQVSLRDQPLLQELCFGTCRFQPQLSAYLDCLLDKPLRAKDSDIQALLLLGLYQLLHTRIPDHAALGETVEVTRSLKKPWATKLVNGVLRKFQRDQAKLDLLLAQNYAFQSNHPAWLEGALRKSWPAERESIIAANNGHPPFSLRLNTHKIARSAYLDLLKQQGINAFVTQISPYGITLEQACDPRQLPYFAQGWVSVQDEAAQLSADLLCLSPGLRVLDACSAPGGKTGHMLERESSLLVTALDADERRLLRVHDNLGRLGVAAKVVCGDATQTGHWWDGQRFDRILLDAPCSATGIIRRHPDIKSLRSPEDIAKLAQLQGQLLDNLWPLLQEGGLLLYATCSVMPEENTQVIAAFLARQGQAQAEPLLGSPELTPEPGPEFSGVPWGVAQPQGRQLLPRLEGHDGFYYALLRKAQ